MIVQEENLSDYTQKSKPPKTVRLLVFITPEEKEGLKGLSCSTRLSMTEIVRRSLYNVLNS